MENFGDDVPVYTDYLKTKVETGAVFYTKEYVMLQIV